MLCLLEPRLKRKARVSNSTPQSLVLHHFLVAFAFITGTPVHSGGHATDPEPAQQRRADRHALAPVGGGAAGPAGHAAVAVAGDPGGAPGYAVPGARGPASQPGCAAMTRAVSGHRLQCAMSFLHRLVLAGQAPSSVSML